MSNYSVQTNFGAKDGLASGNAAKIIRGAEFTVEFNNIATAIATKLDLTSGSATDLTTTGTLTNSGAMTTTGVSTFNGAVNFASTTAHTGNATFSDNAKAIFGAGADLQIYHDGTDTHIVESGAGSLKIKGNFLQLLSPDNEKFFEGQANGASSLFYNGLAKLDTSNNGIDVTGTATMDGLTVDGSGIFQGTSTQIDLIETDAVGNNTRLRQTVGDFFIQTVDNSSANPVSRFNLDHATGDISFYEDTGTAPKLTWDASAESLGIGTTSPDSKLHVRGSSSGATGVADGTLIVEQGSAPSIQILSANTQTQTIKFGDPEDGDVGKISYSHADNHMGLFTDGTEAMRIDSTGNVGIGTDSPDAELHVADAGSNVVIRIESSNSHQGNIFFDDQAAANVGKIGYDHSDNSLQFDTSSTEAMRIDSSGNVGIGTDSPQSPLHVQGTGTTAIQVTGGSSNVAGIYLGDAGGLANGRLSYSNSDNSLQLFTDGSEAMRIDSSGNVLVNKTGSNFSVEGIELRGSPSSLQSVATFTRDGQNVAAFNRLTDDGSIVDFSKDGITIGSIGNTSNDLKIESNGNLLFKNSISNDFFASFTANGGSTIYYDNSPRIETRVSDTLFYGNGIAAATMVHPSPSYADSKCLLSGDTSYSETDATLLQSKNSLNLKALGGSVNIGTDSVASPQLQVFDTYTESLTFRSDLFQGKTTTTSLLTFNDNNAFSSTNGTSLFSGNDLNLLAGLNDKIQFGQGGAGSPAAVVDVTGGNFGIGTTSPTEKLDIDGDSIRLRQSQTPASASATGSQGQIAWDANYMYVCTATDTWKRVALATW